MKKVKSKEKKIGVIVGSIVGFVVAYLVVQTLFTPPSFDKQMMKAASQINESCPIMVDQETRLDNAIALPGNILQYNYTLVHLVKDSVNIMDFESYIRPQIVNNIKTNPNMKAYRDNKITMAYNYKDMNGTFITKITVKPQEYLGVKEN